MRQLLKFIKHSPYQRMGIWLKIGFWSYSCCLCYIFAGIVTDDSMIISKIAGQGHQHEACNHYPLFTSALCLVFAIAFLSKYIKYRPDQKQYYKGHYSFYHGMNSEIRKRLPIREVCECTLAIQEFLSQKESSSIQEGDDGTYQQFPNEISLFYI